MTVKLLAALRGAGGCGHEGSRRKRRGRGAGEAGLHDSEFLDNNRN